MLVAGDLFDSSQATKATVSSACGAIGALGVPVLVIPGNHDHGGAGTIWEQGFFVGSRAARSEPPGVVWRRSPSFWTRRSYCRRLLRRQDAGDPTAWIRSVEIPSDLPRVVLAHGTVQGFGGSQADDEDISATANFIDLARLESDEIDYIALGDWHGTKQS